MTGLQLVVNIVLAVLAYLLVTWLLGFIPLPAALVVIAGVVAAVVVFLNNTAARIGV